MRASVRRIFGSTYAFPVSARTPPTVSLRVIVAVNVMLVVVSDTHRIRISQDVREVPIHLE